MTGLGRRTTAEEALRGASLAGRIAIVTGASAGLGVETARVLALAGAKVILACRSESAGEEVARTLGAMLPSGVTAFETMALDLSDLRSVRDFATGFLATGRPLHLLVNNAGVMATPLGATAQGAELQVGTNHVGHFLLTKLLRAPLEAGHPSRIVNLSSDLHGRGRGERLLETLTGDPGYRRRKYVPFDAYGDSKLANVLFTRALAARLPDDVMAFALHPGVIPTKLTRSLGLAGAAFRLLARPFLKSIPQGAATTIFAATAPELRGQSGAYLADCGLGRSSGASRDDALANRLWDVTEALVADFAPA